ncbi:LOW QUALITY PROTEIN: C-X-C chemokine receptor type 1-like [Anguilla anguilla]|uniref:LOW QUALITY PROTEIN: C-X-C chemokine receptor type 1-like n=1 Tax=Anguilla anguilla TaxID=7936 RepID=UPI0015AE8702|nr:LOW QUALITY PROTEIN: C-X-C chemokine receptor type 1-like [Anguilla anguilla]
MVSHMWIFGTVLGKLASGLQEATFYSGVLLLACISVDRYLAIVKAAQPVFKTRHLVVVVCGGVWLAAVGLLSLPVLVQRETFQPGNQERLVYHENLSAENAAERRLGLRVLRHAAGFFLPLAVLSFCYSFTVAMVLRGCAAQKHKAMRVILWVLLAFVGRWLPNNMATLTDSLMRAGWVTETSTFRNRVDLALEVTQVLAFLHCAINPILYAFIGHRLRNQCLTVLFKHGLISKKVLSNYRHSSTRSSSSYKTSITM